MGLGLSQSEESRRPHSPTAFPCGCGGEGRKSGDAQFTRGGRLPRGFAQEVRSQPQEDTFPAVPAEWGSGAEEEAFLGMCQSNVGVRMLRDAGSVLLQLVRFPLSSISRF